MPRKQHLFIMPQLRDADENEQYNATASSTTIFTDI